MRKSLSVLIVLTMLLGVFTACKKEIEQVTLEDIRNRGEIIIGVKTDVPYFSYYDEVNGTYSGYEIEIARLIAEDLFGSAEKVTFFPVTAKTRTVHIEHGDIDLAIASFSVNEERQAQVNFSPGYYQDYAGLLTRNDSDIHGLADLNGKSIGVVQNSSAGNAINEAAKNLGITVRIVTYATYDDVLSAVIARRCDAFCTDRAILKGYINAETILTPDRFAPQNYAVATKKENIELAAYIDGLIEKWSNDGTLEALKEKYGI
jgi:putative glutamine transport system substrate-binding protein